MGMSIDKAIEFFNGLECYTPQAKDARDVALNTMRKYQKIFDNFEILTASFEDSDSPEVRSKKVDEFCIETMRGLLGKYYAERMAEDGNDSI